VALCAAPDWRWLLDRADSPWYPTMRLFRQKELNRWDDVFQEIAAELAKLAQSTAAAGRPVGPIRIETDPGDLIDRITILEVKTARITDAAKLANVKTQLAVLSAARDRAIVQSAELSSLHDQLRDVNAKLWDIEDDIRLCERDQNFGPRFVELARAVYHTNDQRAALKRAINTLLSAAGGEEKQYAQYAAGSSSGTPGEGKGGGSSTEQAVQ
jgi:hypothetical protein